MSRQTSRSLQVPSSNGGGTAARLRDVGAAAVYIHAPSAMTAALQVQGKVGDGHDDWCDVGDPVTNANTLVQVPAGFTHIRLNRTGATNADVKAELVGQLRGE